MSSSNPLIEGKTARLQPSFQVHDFKNNESKIRRQIPEKKLINLFCWWGWGEDSTMLLSTKLFDQLTVVAAQLQSCYQPPQPVSFLLPDQDKLLYWKCFGLAWVGYAWPFKRQPRIKKIGQSRMRRGFQDEGQSRLIWNLNEQGASGYYRFNDKDNGIEWR